MKKSKKQPWTKITTKLLAKKPSASKIFSFFIILLLGLLGLALSFGWINDSFAYDSPLEGEISITFEKVTQIDREGVREERPRATLKIEGNFIALKYWRDTITEGKEPGCIAGGRRDIVLFEMLSSSGRVDGKFVWKQYTKETRHKYLDHPLDDYICFMVVWGDRHGEPSGRGNTGISYGPYRLGSDVTAENWDDLLSESNEDAQQNLPDNESNNQQQDPPPANKPPLSLTLSQSASPNDDQIRVTAAYNTDSEAVISTWKYVVADTETISIESAREDCPPLFGSSSTAGILISEQSITESEGDLVYADISAEHSEEWICIQAVDQNNTAVYSFVKLMRYERDNPAPQQETNTQAQNNDDDNAANIGVGNNDDDNDTNIGVGNSDDSNTQNDDIQENVIVTANNRDNQNEIVTTNSQDLNLQQNQIANNNTDQNNNTGFSAPNDANQASPEETEVSSISNAGVFGDQVGWTKLAGYILVAAAILGTTRILIIKKKYNH